MNWRLYIYGIIILAFIMSCGDDTDPVTNTRSQLVEDAPGQMAQLVSLEEIKNNIPEIQKYIETINSVLVSKIPVLLLAESQLDEAQSKVQKIALADSTFLRDCRHPETKEVLHSEIMSIKKASPQLLQAAKYSPNCKQCYEVVMYNFFHHNTTLALVDLEANRIVTVGYFAGRQNTIRKGLKDLAVKIALDNPELAKELGIERGKLSGGFELQIRNSKLERSRHLCVAPTFVKGKRALWAVVDLTDLRLVGYKWIENASADRPQIVTERGLQNRSVMEKFCDVENEISKGNWDITYKLTSSDGLEILRVKYKGKQVIKSAKLVDWHVSYVGDRKFGYSDAIGCPMFSSAAVVAFGGPETEAIKGGFALIQDFRSPVWPFSCNYRYQNRFEFYEDGSFRIAGVNMGLGCGKDGWYRPVFRIDLSSVKEHFEAWNGSDWEAWGKEKWHLQEEATAYSPESYLFKIVDEKGAGFYIRPDRGDLGEGSRGDHAFSYVTVHHPEEGEADMPTFGECCNDDFHQGPEEYMNPPESIQGQDLVFWYVPQMENDDTPGKEFCWAATHVKNGKAEDVHWRGVAGPLFVPVK